MQVFQSLRADFSTRCQIHQHDRIRHKPSDPDRTSALDARPYEKGNYNASGAKDVMIGWIRKTSYMAAKEMIS